MTNTQGNKTPCTRTSRNNRQQKRSHGLQIVELLDIDCKMTALTMFKEIKIQLEHFSRELETIKYITF